MNYYVLLGVSPDADAETIRRAFRALARRYHPDAGEGSSADRFREILTAYHTLIDAARRLSYDRTLGKSRASFVEPLRARVAPEPMLRPTTGGVRVFERLAVTGVGQLVEDLFESWDDVFWVARRRRDRR